MAEYIEREAVIAVLLRYGMTDDGEAIINAIPAADVVERPRWIPITERLPKYGDWVLGIGKRKGYYVCEYRGLSHFYSGDEPWFSSKGRAVNVTHWMPLPEPPKEDTT